MNVIKLTAVSTYRIWMSCSIEHSGIIYDQCAITRFIIPNYSNREYQNDIYVNPNCPSSNVLKSLKLLSTTRWFLLLLLVLLLVLLVVLLLVLFLCLIFVWCHVYNLGLRVRSYIAIQNLCL